MGITDDLVPVLKKLKLSGILQTMELRLQQAVDDDMPPLEFLYRLLIDEVERRESRQLQLRIHRAGFEHAKTLEDFEFVFNPQVPKAKVLDLATCLFIERSQNVLLLGPTDYATLCTTSPTL